MKQNPDYILDFRGTITSITLLKASRIYKEMKPSEIMLVKGCDINTRTDLFQVLSNDSYELIDMNKNKDNTDTTDCFHIRKQ